MPIDVEALKASVDMVAVVGHITPLRKVGNEFVGRCQSGEHPDENPSMYVSQRKGFIHCFSCGWHCDIIEFVMHTMGMDFKAATEWLGAKPDLKPIALTAARRAPQHDRITSKPPPDAGTPDMTLYKLGAPVRIWPYRDSAGDLLGYVARYQPPGEDKSFRCWSWGSVDDAAPRWACGHWNRPRPLYGLERLAARPDAPVLLTEGEKSADAAGRLLPAYVAMTWPGGAGAAHLADLAPLAGRKVLLWPDADDPSHRAMQAIAAALHDPAGLACSIRFLDPLQAPKGWDAADAEAEGWTTERLAEWAAPRVADWTPPVAALEPAGEAQGAPAPEAPAGGGSAGPRLVAIDGKVVDGAPPGEEPAPMALSESGVALEFVSDRCGDLRYCHEWAKWLHWTGTIWRPELNRQTAWERIRSLTYGIKYRPEARDLTPSSKLKFERKQFMAACLDLAEFDRRIIVTPDIFDADPFLLGTPVGTVDLRTGTIRPPRREDYITRHTAVAPADGKHPMFDQVIECASGGKPEMAAFIWRWLGYILTGSVQEEAFLFLYGKPACGKSTLVEAIAAILGNTDHQGYATKAPVELFTESKNERSGQLHILHGARFAHASETEENRHWKAALLKEATGGDTLSGERKYENVFSFRPTHKLLIHGNHRPHMRTADEGMRRRMHLLEYAADIPEEKRDPLFKARLAEEYPFILQSMIRGCLAWIEAGGLIKPEAITESVSEYFEDEDTIGAWVLECTRTGPGMSVGTTDAYKAYSEFCDTRGERAPSHKRFTMMMKSRGFEVKKSGTQRFVGLSLTEATHMPGWADRD